MEKILITGGTGLIGSHLLPLLKDEYRLHLLLRQVSPHLEHEPNITTQQINLASDWQPEQLPKSIDSIIYLAQSEYFREFPDKSEHIFQVNTYALLKLLNYAMQAGCKTFIYASSGGVYGSQDKHLTEDQDPPARGNLGFYLSSKLCSEILLENYASYMNTIALRFFFVYGPGQNPSMLIPRLIRNVSQQSEITLQGERGLIINPIYVSDAARCVQGCLNIEGRHTLNIAGNEELGLRDIGLYIADCLGTDAIFKVIGEQKQTLIGDISKLTQLFGSPEIPFKQGVKRVVEHMHACKLIG